MKALLAALAIVLISALPARAQDIVGDWLGTLNVGPASLRLVLHITGTDGRLSASLDSLDQGANGIPVASISFKDSSLAVSLPVINGSYQGTLSADGETIDGTWTQVNSLPLVFRRVKDVAEITPKRPQQPVPPFPYRQQDVTYTNASANVTLAGTLTLPAGSGPFPAVVLITGSGPQDRDETLLGHRPFLVLADHLTRHGIAVLRADDRGVGKSTGNFLTATTPDFATDVEAGVAYLLTRPEIDKRRIGLVGHSEGAIVAPMVAVRDSTVAFVVMLAGSGVPGDRILVAQSAAIGRASGLPPAQVDESSRSLRDVLDLIKAEPDIAVLQDKIRATMAGKVPPAQVDLQVKALTTPWFRYFLAYDPEPVLRRLTKPVLALNGEKDLQVPAKENLDAIRAALSAAGNTRFEAIEMPGLNHLFQTAKTGSPVEYSAIEETMSPAVLEKVTSWILSQTR